jgi:hypothetical protein
MNNKGQMIILKIMLAVVMLISVMIISTALKEGVDNASTALSCSDSGLPVAKRATCIITDFSLFYFIGIAISVSMAFLAGKKNISGVVTAIVTFVVLAVLISPLKDFIVYLRDASHLNCVGTGISVAARLSCIFIDLWLFWFALTVLAAVVTYIVSDKILPSSQ